MKTVYLDNAANTPIDKDVLLAMKPYLSTTFVGNSNSTHEYGMTANIAVEDSRRTIADVLGVEPRNVLFTSGASESNNWVIKSTIFNNLYKRKSLQDSRIVCGSTEHTSVINACKQAQEIGMDVVFLDGYKGRIKAAAAKKLITSNTELVCIMAVNNETGAVSDVEQIAQYAKMVGAKVLIDCTQLMSYGGKYIKLFERYPSGDYFSFSAHKFYGPTGVGCLIARDYALKELQPMINGGAQESGFRGGTCNTAGIVGMAKAIELLGVGDNAAHYEKLFNYFVDRCKKLGNSNIIYEPQDSRSIISFNCSLLLHSHNLANDLTMLGVAVSAGSACDTTHDETKGDFNGSHVLKDLGLTEQEIRNTIRVSFSKYTTTKDIDQLAIALETLIEGETK